MKNVALDLKNEEEPVTLSNEPSKPLVSLASSSRKGNSGSSRTFECIKVRLKRA